MTSSAVSVRKVESSQDSKTFLEFPWTIYKDDPNWVPPLVSMRKKLLDKTKNPSWEYLSGDYFIAWRGDQPVGTIAAFVNHRHNETWKEQIGWFGFFESIDDQDVANALLKAAADHVRSMGNHTAIRGPAQFTMNDECALLIENFSQPVLLMPYNHAYYQKLIEQSGLHYDKCMDLYSWYSNPDLIQSEGGLPAKLVRVVEKIKTKNKVTVRKPDAKRLREELQLLREIWTSAWAQNWGNVAPTDHEMDHLFKDLKDYFDPELCRFGLVDGETAGFLLAMPDMNQVLKLAYPRPGEPEIWTLLKLLWHWKVRNVIKGQRILLMGVKPEYRMLGVDSAMNLAFFEQGIHNKYYDTDAGWVLETNQPMNQLSVAFHAKLYKRYRIYQKSLIEQ